MHDQYIADVIITVMKDDPTKIVEVRQAAEAMPIFEGETLRAIMAEEALHEFKVNAAAFPELKLIDEDTVLTLLENEFERLGW